MPFADYVDFADCVSKNSNKDDPEAYCATIKRAAEGIIHNDFLKIYKQFIQHSPSEEEGVMRYHKWEQ